MTRIDSIPSRRWRRLSWLLPNALTTAGVVAMVLGTAPDVDARFDEILGQVMLAVAAVLAAVFIVNLWKAAAQRRSHQYLASSNGMVDFVCAAALPLGWALAPVPHDARLFALVWTLRYISHANGLSLFWRVMVRSRIALFSIAGLFVVVTLTAATLAHVFERGAQPQAFGSIERTLWWAIATLTTTGYGDVVPTTIWGRLLAGWVMVGGIVMFALHAGIIATAFAEELQRRHFLRTWELVISVPLFRDLGAAAVADIVRLLQSRDVEAGTVVMRKGDPGDTMYFIVSGEATVHIAPKPVVLGPGSFFGEMSLLFGGPRTATVVATKPSVLLVLDIADLHDLAGRRPEFVNLIETEARLRRDRNDGTAG
ncbi:cyclic nucleotide-gated ion channel [Rhodopseudomonas telluris]|uniref:Cyclic nucleotide-gated ion channel n=1 Tax=Rhodopseudomonas telluris TaxID=644215 RepID=A0ABV6EMS8_9BRAD